MIAHRGAVAARAVDTFRTRGGSPIAVVALSAPQRLHTPAADGCEYLEGTGLAETYDHAGRIVDVARRCGGDAVYPGYGAQIGLPVILTPVTGRGGRGGWHPVEARPPRRRVQVLATGAEDLNR
ncbi:biotin carboxylase N-terminal domain-containing protein [Streptomyces sp. NPDC050448]|uniref:biotin carboxylase N-terminal domain-containing protein n=1 Tax=Streptomyces sp. NPDC050448 TaxID=3155404 RepID=UPI003449F3FE